MRLYVSTACVFCFLPSFAFSEEPEKVEVSIEVKHADGTEASGAVAGHSWRIMEYGPDHPLSRMKDGKTRHFGPKPQINELFTSSGITADDDGHLTISVAPSDLPTTYFLMSQDHREGAIVVFQDVPSVLKQQGAKVRLEKMATVKLDIVRPLPADPRQSFVYVGVIHDESGSNIYGYSGMNCSPTQAEVTTEFRLPVGKYQYFVQSDGCARNLRDLVIHENQAGQEMRIEAKLAPKFIRAYAGKVPPPLCTTGNFGAISRDAIDKHKGRLLLLVFFREAGCGPQEDLKKLFGLYHALDQKQKDDRILIHCARGVRDEKDYQSKVVDPIQREHKEIKFSVPVLLDGDRCTIRSWGIDHLPTAVLLDENGRVVEQGSPWTMWSRVDGQKQPPTR